MKFKVGDKVQFKEWDEIEKEFGVDCYGNIKCKQAFTTDMRKFCGKKATIEHIDDDFVYLDIDTKGWRISEDMLKLVESKKMTLKEFFESKAYLAIHCKTLEQAETFCKEADKLGYKRISGARYTEDNHWYLHMEQTCYTNCGGYCSIEYYQIKQFKILEFDDINWNTTTIKEEKNNMYQFRVIFDEIDWNTTTIKEEKNNMYQFRVMESRRSVSLYKGDVLLKRVYCHEGDEFDWHIGLGIALQRTVYKDNADVKYLAKILGYKNMALYCLNKFCNYDLSKLDKHVANRKKEDKLIKF